MFRLRQRLLFFKFTLKQYQQLKQHKQFRKILNASPTATYQQLRANFFQLIKEYHPDKNIFHAELSKAEYEQITKIITEAYTILTNQYVKQQTENTKKSDKEYKPQTEQDRIYYEVFKRHRYQDPYAFYKPQNQHLKREYLQRIKEMGERGKEKEAEEQFNTSSTYQKPKDYQRDPNASSRFLPIVLAASGLVALSLYLFLPKHQQPNRPKITDQQIKKYEAVWRARLVDRRESVISHFERQQAPSLQFDPFGNISLNDQLTRYTIIPDIKLYEVHPNVFDHPKRYEFQNENLRLSPLNQIRPNTAATLALEAERCLQNIYVSKEYLLQQLKTKGYFQCPGVFFRFHGYIYFKLRPKSLNLSNYRGEDWISLFDLYFKYYSPIFYYQDYFDTHFYPSEKLQEFGDIHFNTRTIPLYHLKPGQKNVFMWTPKGGNYKWYEQRYKHIWTNYYSYYVPFGAKHQNTEM